MKEAELLTRIAERAEVSEEETERVLEILVEDLAASLRERRGKPLAVEVPPYFDRYVTSEINRVSGQIVDLKKDVTQGFADLRGEMNRRFGEVDRRFGELRGEINRRFEEMDWRFDRIDRWFWGWESHSSWASWLLSSKSSSDPDGRAVRLALLVFRTGPNTKGRPFSGRPFLFQDSTGDMSISGPQRLVGQVCG